MTAEQLLDAARLKNTMQGRALICCERRGRTTLPPEYQRLLGSSGLPTTGDLIEIAKFWIENATINAAQCG